MRRIDLSVEHLPDKIELGHAGENEAIELYVDVSPWVEDWESCSISVNILRPFEDAFYTVDGELDGTVYTYVVTNTDTAIAGTGTLEFVCVSDGKVITSAVTKFFVGERLRGTVSPEPPEPVLPWLNRALQAADDAEGSAQRAETAAESIESIEPRVDALEANDALQDTAISALEANDAVQDAAISTNAGEISSIKARTTALEANDAVQDTNIATNTAAIANAEERIEAIESTSLFIDANGKFYVNMEDE